MKYINWRYWTFQIVGWGLWFAFGVYSNLVVYKEFFDRLFTNPTNEKQTLLQIQNAQYKFLVASAITFICAIAITHIFRLCLKKIKWLDLPINKLFSVFIIVAFTSGIALHFGSDFFEQKFNVSLDEYRNHIRIQGAENKEKEAGITINNYKDTTNKQIVAINNEIKKTTGLYRNDKGKWVIPNRSQLTTILFTILLTALWFLIYIVWHYVGRSRTDQMAQIRLETTVKELELKTIKAHINPHFIFNSLNSIRALVDENPERARGAITELSNLLRSSMQAEKNETVTLEKELKIVEDYLALEKIRFEDRLQVSLHIDEDTLDQLVPPMMVQILVENAIKHGISKQINGGTIAIYSDFVMDHYQLKIINTGTLIPSVDSDGFGLKSTEDRLKLLFGKNANFTIIQATPNTVQVTVNLPIKINI